MTQYLRPTSILTNPGGWAGSSSDVADSGGKNSATYMESPLSPTSTQYVEYGLGTVTVPFSGAVTVRFEAEQNSDGGTAQKAVVRLYNGGDGSLIATRTLDGLTGSPSEAAWSLSESEKSAVTDWNGIIARVWGEAIGARTVLTASDMAHVGMHRVPATGSWAYSAGPLAVRYVSGQRRYLTIDYDRTLYELADSGSPTTSLNTSPRLSVVRNWGTFATWANSYTVTNGLVCTAMWWDEPQQLLWYTLCPVYDGSLWGFLGASRLNDNGTVTKYPSVSATTPNGLWLYTPPGYSNTTFKQLFNWIVPIPDRHQSALSNARVALGAGNTSVIGDGHRGMGLGAVPLPSVSSTSAITTPATWLAAYHGQLPGVVSPEYYAQREQDYSLLEPPSLLQAPNGVRGYWALPVDVATGYAWVETATKHGVVAWGRRGSGRMWYGEASEYQATLGITDTVLGSSGYHAETHSPCTWIYDPDVMLSAAAGTVSPNTVTFASRFSWVSQFPTCRIAERQVGGVNYPLYVLQQDTATANGMTWDATAQQLVWWMPWTDQNDPRPSPTLQVFSVT